MTDHTTTAAAPSSEPAPYWSPLLRFGFRCTFSYVLLAAFPFPLMYFPVVGVVAEWWETLMHTVVPWVGANVLHLSKPITIFPNGSGDTTYNYVEVLCIFTASVVIGLLWSLIDRRRVAYPRLHDMLRTYVRYFLVVAMLGYGFAKVFKSQFPTPSGERLLVPYGESSPMGILWTFMGASTAYTVFAGLAEVTGGVLLLWRRTTLLGALVVAGVMLNVVMLNFCYDVPVKLHSTFLLLLAIFLTLPDLRQLLDFFVFQRPVRPRPLHMPFSARWLNVTRRIFKVVIASFVVFTSVYGGYQSWTMFGDGSPNPPLVGIYDVELFSRDGAEVTVAKGDPTRWRRAVVTRYGGLVIQNANDSWTRYMAKVDPEKRTITLTIAGAGGKTPTTAELQYSEPTPDVLAIEGSIGDERVVSRMKRVDESTFLLLNRGFHWINEYPYNR